ncbi:hypothetical protein BDD12DRAFT_808397 [Trichophaea hybrida]|nr:hypothetical protein BDD12DRAFT_808397 [Trichophaea hybrida]
MAATRQAGEEYNKEAARINLSGQDLGGCRNCKSSVANCGILKPIPLPPPPPAPAVSEQEEEVEGEDEEITEAIEDELFEVHRHDLEEEIAARIMMQHEIDRGDIYGIGSAAILAMSLDIARLRFRLIIIAEVGICVLYHDLS